MSVNIYRVFNTTIYSAIPLPELELTNAKEPAEITFLASNQIFPETSEFQWSQHWRLPDGRILLSCAKLDNLFLLRFPEIADFHINFETKVIQCHSHESVDDNTVRHLLLDQVIPRYLGHTGSIILHAGAVQKQGNCIAFLGGSGFGKSTLASFFHNHGYTLLTDDCIMIDSKKPYACIPSYTGVRMFDDSIYATFGNNFHTSSVASYSYKKRIELDRKTIYSEKNPCLAAIFLLDKSDSQCETIKIQRLNGMQKIIELVKHSFIMDVSNQSTNSILFNKQAAMANSKIPFFKLTYPNAYDLLPQVLGEVESALNT